MATSTKIRIGPVRFSFAHVFKAHAMKEGDAPKFTVRALIPKKDLATVKKIKKAIHVATVEGKEKFKGKKPTEYPLRDGDKDRPGDGSHRGMWYINCKSDTAPGVGKMVNGDWEEIEDQREFYAGCWGYITLNFFAFGKGSVGIGAGLNHICKTKDDKPLNGKGNAKDDFADMEIEDDDDFENDSFDDTDEDDDDLGAFA